MKPTGTQLNLFFNQELTSSLEASRDYASPSQSPESEKGQMMTVTSGRKCYELYEKLDLHGSLVKTLAASLLLGEGWYSSRRALTWKRKDTKSKRLLFQLSPSMLHTGEIGSGLLPTARVSMGNGASKSEILAGNPKGRLETTIALLPTATSCDHKSRRPGSKQVGLDNLMKLLPTSQSRDGRGVAIKTRDDIDSLIEMGTTKGGTGTPTGLKLQPPFVEWMMGYPPGWTDLNYQNQDTAGSGSSPSVTP